MKKPLIGDVFEIVANLRWYYIQFVGTHLEYGDTIAIVPKSFAERQMSWESHLNSKSVYLIFYPLKACLRHQLCTLVANVPCRFTIPRVLRRPGRIETGGRVVNWMIDQEDGTIRVTETLTEQEKQITLGAGWNHEMLLHRIDEQWQPTMYA